MAIPVSERCGLDKVGRLCNVGNRFLQPRLKRSQTELLQRPGPTKGLLKPFSSQTFRPRKVVCDEGNVVQLQWRRHRGQTLPRAARAASAACWHVAACKVCRHVSHAFVQHLAVVRATLHKRFDPTISRLAAQSLCILQIWF